MNHSTKHSAHHSTSHTLALRVENLAKQYRLGAHQPMRSLREMVSDAVGEGVKRPLDLWRGTRHARNGKAASSFWALEDVSFEVQQGETVGIIGRNGAGKSTLLKILARITRPTRGRVEGYGRVGSLLEVGTGFHPELSGRENIYLNGAILGMTRREIQAKFDEIVAFAEFEDFLDTPVKRYSSGMYMRLAFAVAAHLEPDILIVDEVLAVGDAAFQQKCLGKMGDVARAGRTVLFVSHNMGAIQALCQRGIFLRQGRIHTDGSAVAAVNAYLRTLEEQAAPDLLARTERRGAGLVRVARVEVTGADTPGLATLVTGRAARFVFHLSALHPGLTCSFTIYDQMGQPVTYFDSAVPCALDEVGDAGQFVCEVDALTLVPGRYRLNVALARNHEVQDHVEGAAFFEVAQGEVNGRPVPLDAGYGSVLLQHRWQRPA